jgi:hypothetical protein
MELKSGWLHGRNSEGMFEESVVESEEIASGLVRLGSRLVELIWMLGSLSLGPMVGLDIFIAKIRINDGLEVGFGRVDELWVGSLNG